MSTSQNGGPIATIVITTHNRRELAQRAISSALGQTLAPIEVVVIDNGSTPAFTSAMSDDRVRVIRRDGEGGIPAARNAGLAVARGTWITFLDDDDVLVPRMLERSLAVARSSSLPGPVAAMSAVTMVDLEGHEGETLIPPPMLRRGEDFFLERRGAHGRASNSIVAPTAVVRAIGGIDEGLAIFQQDDFGLRLNAVASIVGLDEPLYRMTVHGEARMSARWAEIPADMERTLAKHPEAFARHRRAHAHYLGTLGVYHLKAGNRRQAVRWCLRALRRDPTQPRLWMFAAAALVGPRSRRSGAEWRKLTARRARKYGRRIANYPRAAAASPTAGLAWSVARRRLTLPAPPGPGDVLLLSIYRKRNSAHVARLLEEVGQRGWEARLWALDDVEPALASQTVGVGGGAKFPQLNRALGTQPDLDRFAWVIVADDDFIFRRGSLGLLLALADRARLDLVQPAHSELSHRDNEITVRRPLALARRTSYVEIGPLFAVKHPWTKDVLPFPSGHEMGWGLELEWTELARRGARLGITDAVTIRHLQPVGRSYRKDRANARLRELMRAKGLTSLADVQRTLEVWRPWQAEPPWNGHYTRRSVHSQPGP